MIEWLTILAAALEREFADRPRVMALATVDTAGRPHVRSVVCRELKSDGNLLIVSDARSEKNHHLRINPSAEVLFWLAGERVQFRIAGTVRLESAADAIQINRMAAWSKLTPASRALFYWPTPGEAAAPTSAFVEDVPDDAPIPANFELLELSPHSVERLDTGKRPHHRRAWSIHTLWAGADINP